MIDDIYHSFRIKNKILLLIIVDDDKKEMKRSSARVQYDCNILLYPVWYDTSILTRYPVRTTVFYVVGVYGTYG